MPRREDIDMTAEPARLATTATPEPRTHAPEHPEQAVQAFSQFLASGRPLSQRFDAAARWIEEAKEAKSPDTSLSESTRTGGIEGEEPPSATEPLREPPIDARSRENNPDVIDKLRAAIAARVEQETRFRLTSLMRRLSVWLGLGICLVVSAHLALTLINMPKPKAVNSAVPATSLIANQAEQTPAIAAPPAEQAPAIAAPPAEQASAITAPPAEQGSAIAAPPAEQASVIAAPSLIAKPVERSYEKPAASSAEPPKAATSQGGRNVAEQHLSAEKIAGLLARGDALVSRADIASARLVYERAAAAGNAEAALRLGISYDPSFLSRAGVKGSRGDAGLAAYWYERARALDAGGNQAETQSSSGR